MWGWVLVASLACFATKLAGPLVPRHLVEVRLPCGRLLAL